LTGKDLVEYEKNYLERLEQQKADKIQELLPKAWSTLRNGDFNSSIHYFTEIHDHGILLQKSNIIAGTSFEFEGNYGLTMSLLLDFSYPNLIFSRNIENAKERLISALNLLMEKNNVESIIPRIEPNQKLEINVQNILDFAHKKTTGFPMTKIIPFLAVVIEEWQQIHNPEKFVIKKECLPCRHEDHGNCRKFVDECKNMGVHKWGVLTTSFGKIFACVNCGKVNASIIGYYKKKLCECNCGGDLIVPDTKSKERVVDVEMNREF
jgi:hypothetical protein